MHIPDNTRVWLIDILKSNLFLQLAPLLVLFFVPALVLFAVTALHPARLLYILTMGLESIGLGLSWIFSSNSKSNSSASRSRSSGHKKAKKPRTKAEQVAQNGSVHRESKYIDEGYYPGLVNISGTYCFMNSTLQALASLTYLQPHLDVINAKAEALDVPTPVIDALQELFRRLNKPHSSYHAIRPTDIIQALSSQTEGRSNSLFYSREHQDAQELFQVVSECVKNEISAVDKEAYRDRGLGGLAKIPPETMKDIGKSVFDGLTANRRSCCTCGYTEAVMHFALDNWQLAVPRLEAVCRLEDCLADYTRLEVLGDCICRKCSVIATLRRLQHEVLKLEEETGPDKKPSNSKKERLKRVRKMEVKVRKAITEERIEDDMKDIRMEKVVSPASTKQAMIARPPPVLALHINRSVHYGHYASKNNVRLIFPEVLDLTPYTTSGNLSTIPTSAISTPPPALPRSTTPTPSTYSNPRIIYRLAAVVCHYGQHSFGHYICYRRKPRHPSVGSEKRWVPPRIIDPYRLEDDSSSINNNIPNGDVDGIGLERSNDGLYSSSTTHYVFSDEAESRPGKGWLRISDDAVRECGIETVLQEGMGAFMLYYERAVLDLPGVYLTSFAGEGRDGSPRSSEETLKPELRTVDLNGSIASLVSEVGVGVRHSAGQSQKPSSLPSSSQPDARPHTHEHGKVKSKLEERKPVPGLSASVNLDTRKGRPSTASIPTITPKPSSPLPVGLSASLSLSHSPMSAVPGARIVRNVTSSRRSASATPRSRTTTESPVPMQESNGHATPTTAMMAKGLHSDLSASAPSLVDTTSRQITNGALPTTATVVTVSQSGSSSSSPKSKHKSKHHSGSSSSRRQQEEVQRVHSPPPPHPLHGMPIEA